MEFSDYYDYDEDASYDFTTTSDTTYKYDNAITFAYRFGAGLTFDRISIGLHWYNLGSAKVKGKREYEYNDSEGYHDSNKENFKWKDLSISMMTLTVGYHF